MKGKGGHVPVNLTSQPACCVERKQILHRDLISNTVTGSMYGLIRSVPGGSSGARTVKHVQRNKVVHACDISLSVLKSVKCTVSSTITCQVNAQHDMTIQNLSFSKHMSKASYYHYHLTSAMVLMLKGSNICNFGLSYYN